ncbi:MAG: hypothetical protein ACLQIB_46575 [Isosphaeraceae bacterium]
MSVASSAIVLEAAALFTIVASAWQMARINRLDGSPDAARSDSEARHRSIA